MKTKEVYMVSEVTFTIKEDALLFERFVNEVDHNFEWIDEWLKGKSMYNEENTDAEKLNKLFHFALGNYLGSRDLLKHIKLFDMVKDKD